MVGDVSGHGIPAALLMASARAFLRARLLAPGSISEALGDVNRLLTDDLGMTGRFMTLFVLEMDVVTRDIRWARAGHDPALVYDPAADAFAELGGKGIPLGIDREWTFAWDGMAALPPGQVLVLGTDGIWEARDPAGEMYGKTRLKNAVRACSDRTATAIADAVMADLAAFRQGVTRRDDETVVVIKIEET
jgi:sigma-B regulation protein RsbU (phosphoserine phosphatase)